MPRNSPTVLILVVSLVAGVIIGIVAVRSAPSVFAAPAASVPEPPHRTAIFDPSSVADPSAIRGRDHADAGADATPANGPTSVTEVIQGSDPNSYLTAFPPTTVVLNPNGTFNSTANALPEVFTGPKPSKIVSALHALGAAQTKSDVYPLPEFLTETDIDPSTVHRVLTTADGSTLWIGRTPNTICLLFSSGNPFPTDGISAGASCPTTTQFSDSGAVLQEGVDRWTWDGEHFTTTIER